MGLLFLLLLIALVWWLGALQLWLRARWGGEALLWIGGALAVGAATRIA